MTDFFRRQSFEQKDIVRIEGSGNYSRIYLVSGEKCTDGLYAEGRSQAAARIHPGAQNPSDQPGPRYGLVL